MKLKFYIHPGNAILLCLYISSQSYNKFLESNTKQNQFQFNKGVN